MVRPRRVIEYLLALSRRKYPIILDINIRFCLNLYRFIEYLSIMLLNFSLFELVSGRKLFCLLR
jgi:hypothetical protein